MRVGNSLFIIQLDIILQDLHSTAIYSVFLIIILDIYTTVSAFP